MRKQALKASSKIYNVECFENKTIAVDIAILMYRIVCSSSLPENEIEKDSSLKICSKIHDMHSEAKSKNIKLIWVFDGHDASHDKEEEREDRKVKRQRTEDLAEENMKILFLEKEIIEQSQYNIEDAKQKVLEQIHHLKMELDTVQTNTKEHDLAHHALKKVQEIHKNLNTYDEKNTFFLIQRVEEIDQKQKKWEQKKLQIVTQQIYQDLKVYFENEKIDHVMAKGEAERACAWMVKNKMADAAASDDSDILAHGCSIVLRNFIRLDNCDIEMWNFNDILKELDMSYSSFVDLCILCGTDFCDNIHGLGPANALKMIKLYKTIEKLQLSPTFLKYTKAQNYDHVKERWQRAKARIYMDENTFCEIAQQFFY